MAQKFLNGVKSYFNSSNYTLLGHDSLDVVGGDLVLKRDGSEKIRIGVNNTTFAGSVSIQSDNDERFLVRSNDYTISRIISRGNTGTNLDKGLFSLMSSDGTNNNVEAVRIDSAGNSWFNGGAVSFGDNVTVTGNLIVNGTTTTLNTTTVEVEDNILQLNTTQGSPDTATATTSGISVYRGVDGDGNAVTQASFIFDDADDTWDLTNDLAVAGSTTFNGGVVKKGSGGYYLQTASADFRAAFWDNGTETRIFADGNGSTAALVINDNNTSFGGDIKVEKNTPLLELGVSNSSTGNSKLTFFSKNNSSANAYSLQFNKDTDIDRLEFIDGSGNANIKFNNGGSANFAGLVSVASGKAFRLYNAAGTGWGEMSLDETANKIQFNRGIQPSGDNQSDQLLGTSTKRWHQVHAGSFYGDGSNLTNVAVAAHNHDTRYTSTDASGDNYTFEIEDEGNLSGNKWYHIATLNSYNGGLHIRGAILNHVETFASQKLDIAIQVRESSQGQNVEINGSVDVFHNDSATNGTDKAGVRVIQTTTTNSSYQDYKVYVRTTRYSQLTLRLTQQGSVTFNTDHSSPLTSEPAPASGGSMELDTSALLEGHHVIVDSAVKLRVGASDSNFAGTITTSDNSNDNYITATFSDSTYTRIHGYGLYMSRAHSYIRPTGDNNKQLYLGTPTERWSNITFNTLASTFAGNIATASTKKVLFDGASGHTYIAEESDSNLKFYVGGTEQLNITNGGLHFNASLTIPNYINHAGDSGTKFGFEGNDAFRLYTDSTMQLQIDSAGDATFAGSVKVKNALIDNASVTSATTTTTVASVSGTTYAAVFFDYVIYKSSNIRAGTVVACSDGTSVSFTETSTTDLGDTSDVTLAVDYSSSNFRLRATTTSSTWNIKAIIRAI